MRRSATNVIVTVVLVARTAATYALRAWIWNGLAANKVQAAATRGKVCNPGNEMHVLDG